MSEKSQNPYASDRPRRHPLRTWMIRLGVAIAALGTLYLLAGLTGLVPLELVEMRWSNIRIVAGAVITGCLMAAVGYGDE